MWGRGETEFYWVWFPSPIGQHKLTELSALIAESMFSVQTRIFKTKKTGIISKHFDWNLIRCLYKLFHFHCEAPEFANTLFQVFFSVIKHAGFKKLKALEDRECWL